MDIKETIRESGIICSVRGVYGSDLINCLSAVKEGGVALADIAFQQDIADPDKEVAEGLMKAAAAFGGGMFLGAGNALTAHQAEVAAQAGANYLISPIYSPAIIKAAKQAGLFMISGALTPSEVYNAHLDGADMIMLYPTGTFGAGYVRYIVGKGPLSGIDIVACGGVSVKDLGQLYEAGCQAAVIGQYLADKELIKAGDFAGIRRKAQDLVLIRRQFLADQKNQKTA